MFSRDHCKSHITTVADTLVMSFILKLRYAVELAMSHFLQAGTFSAMLAYVPTFRIVVSADESPD